MLPIRLARTLRAERLEDRCTPAITVRLIGGNTYVQGTPVGNLELNVSATSLEIDDNGSTKVTVPKTGDLFVTLTRRPNPDSTGKVTMDLGGSTFAGNVLVDLGQGDGNGGITTNPISFVNGTIGGNVTVLRGDGRENVFFGTSDLITPSTVSILGNVTLAGTTPNTGQFPVNGTNTFVLSQGSRIAGSLQATYFPQVTLGEANGQATIGGNVTVTNPGSSALSVSVIGLIGGNLSVTGSNLDDVVQIYPASVDGVNNIETKINGRVDINLMSGAGQTPTGDALVVGLALLPPLAGQAVTIAGPLSFTTRNTFADQAAFYDSVTLNASASLDLGDGDNSISFNPTATIGGNFNVTAGNGNNSFIDFADPTANFAGTVGNDLRVTFGSGDNSLTFDAGAAIGGNFVYRAGDGQNSIVNNGILDFNNVLIDVGNGNSTNLFNMTGSTVNGSMTIRTGNGGNTTTLNGNATVNGRFTYRGGNGGDTLEITSTSLFTFDALFGTGNDTIDFNNSATQVSGILNGGGGTNNLDNDGNIVFVSPVTVTNFV